MSSLLFHYDFNDIIKQFKSIETSLLDIIHQQSSISTVYSLKSQEWSNFILLVQTSGLFCVQFMDVITLPFQQ